MNSDGGGGGGVVHYTCVLLSLIFKIPQLLRNSDTARQTAVGRPLVIMFFNELRICVQTSIKQELTHPLLLEPTFSIESSGI